MLRLILFLFLCIPLRLVLAYLPRVLPKPYLSYFGFIVCVMAIGTLYLGWTNSRLRAVEAGGRTWWAPFRLVHGVLLLCAALYLSREDRNASVPLLLDVLLGIVLFFVVRVGLV